MTNKFLISTILSLSLLSATALPDVPCVNCKVDLSKLSLVKKVEKRVHTVKAFDSFNSDAERNSEIETIALSHDKYIMTEEEIAKYQEEHLLVLVDEGAETTVSNAVCDDDKLPLYDNETDTYECV